MRGVGGGLAGGYARLAMELTLPFEQNASPAAFIDSGLFGGVRTAIAFLALSFIDVRSVKPARVFKV